MVRLSAIPSPVRPVSSWLASTARSRSSPNAYSGFLLVTPPGPSSTLTGPSPGSSVGRRSPWRRASGGAPARSRRQGAGDHRRPRRRQDDARQLDPEGAAGQERNRGALRADRTPPNASPKAQASTAAPSIGCWRRTRAMAGSSATRRTRCPATCSSWTRPAWWTCR